MIMKQIEVNTNSFISTSSSSSSSSSCCCCCCCSCSCSCSCSSSSSCCICSCSCSCSGQELVATIMSHTGIRRSRTDSYNKAVALWRCRQATGSTSTFMSGALDPKIDQAMSLAICNRFFEDSFFFCTLSPVQHRLGPRNIQRLSMELWFGLFPR